MSISVDQLESLYEENKIEEINNILTILISAINDWPSNIFNLDEYLFEINYKLGHEANYLTIKKFIDFNNCVKFAWEIESLTQLLDIYNYYSKKNSLKEIFIEFENKIYYNL
jgi:hypothetical protein